MKMWQNGKGMKHSGEASRTQNQTTLFQSLAQ